MDTVKNQDLQKKKIVFMATIKIADSQNTALTKTEISEKLF